MPMAIQIAAVFVILLGLTGCGGPNLVAENDALRRQVRELEEQVQALTGERDELIAEIAQLSMGPDAVPEEIRVNTPRPVSISIGRLSHARDDDGDGVADRLVVYVSSADSRARFVQLVGTLAATAAILPPDADAITIGRITLDPATLRDAYRSSFTGTHYTVEIPVTVPQDADATHCVVGVTYEDGRDGQQRQTERSIKLEPAAPPTEPPAPASGG